jgi:hypothetical protein
MNLYVWIPIVCAVAIVAIYFVWVRKLAAKANEPKPSPSSPELPR